MIFKHKDSHCDAFSAGIVMLTVWDIMEIVGKGNPKTAGEIALAHFEPHLLKGMGMAMAENEVLSHCELLMGAG